MYAMDRAGVNVGDGWSLPQWGLGYTVTVTIRLARLRFLRRCGFVSGWTSEDAIQLETDCRRAYSCYAKLVRQNSTKYPTIKRHLLKEEHRTVTIKLRHTVATLLTSCPPHHRPFDPRLTFLLRPHPTSISSSKPSLRSLLFFKECW
jgi:hypothetical protein